MGALAGQSQRKEVRDQVHKLLSGSQILYGSLDSAQLLDADYEQGAFLSPILLGTDKPFSTDAVHDIEAFGPVCTIMPYRGIDDAIALSK